MLSDAVHMANNAEAGGSSQQLSVEEQAREKNADLWNFFDEPAGDVAEGNCIQINLAYGHTGIWPHLSDHWTFFFWIYRSHGFALQPSVLYTFEYLHILVFKTVFPFIK